MRDELKTTPPREPAPARPPEQPWASRGPLPRVHREDPADPHGTPRGRVDVEPVGTRGGVHVREEFPLMSSPGSWTVSKLGPATSEDRPGDDLRGIHDDVSDALTFPGIGDVHQTIFRLDHRGIRVFTG